MLEIYGRGKAKGSQRVSGRPGTRGCPNSQQLISESKWKTWWTNRSETVWVLLILIKVTAVDPF